MDTAAALLSSAHQRWSFFRWEWVGGVGRANEGWGDGRLVSVVRRVVVFGSRLR